MAIPTTSSSGKLFEAKSLWTGQIGSGGVPDATTTTIPLASATGLTNGNAYIFTIDRVDASGNKTPSKREVCIGELSGTNFINCVRGVEGTAQAHSSGAVVEILMTATHWNKLLEMLNAEHNDDGTHKDITATSVTATGDVQGANVTATTAVKTDTISEKTLDAGVTIDGVLLKDNKVTASAGAVLSGLTYPTSDGTSGQIIKTDGAGTLSFGDVSFVGARASKNALQAIANNAWTAVSWDVEDFDVGGLFDVATAPTKFTAPSNGYYLVTSTIRFDNTTTTGYRAARILVNGTGDIALVKHPGGAGDGIPISQVVYLTAGDYVEIYVWQDSGGSVDILADTHTRCAVSKLGS